MLNPWKIEIFNHTNSEICLNLVNQESGEIRQVEIDVNDINNIYELKRDKSKEN